MTPADDFRSLRTSDWDQLQSCADRLEEAWKNSSDVALDAFLPPPDDPVRSIVLHELVKTDLEIRWRHGMRAELEDYVSKYPELGDAKKLSATLIYEEYRVRQCHGDKPTLESYERRFPDQFAELQRLIAEQPIPTVSRVETVLSQAGRPAAEGQRAEQVTGALPTVGTDLVNQGVAYRKIRRIGSGGFGEVWLAEAPGGVEVAIKIIFRPLDHEEAQRELQSLELIKRLRHPFLLATQGFWSEADRLNIVMELADGSLRDRLKECRKTGMTGIPVAELFTYFREAAEALDFLHQQHVLHRDIKPDNILLLQRHAKVADFGLARLQESQRLASVSGSGTPAYMAPEVWRGKASERSDQYSLAMSYAELRLDRRVFSGRDIMEVMLDHVEHQPDLTSMPEAEKQVILKAMAKNPDDRYGSCQEFIQALHLALAESGQVAGAGPAVSGPVMRSSTGRSPGTVDAARMSPATIAAAEALTGPPRRRKHIMVGVVLVLLFLTLAGVGVHFGFRPDEVEEPLLHTTGQPVPRKPTVFLPAGCQSAEEAAVVTDLQGKSYYHCILKPVPGSSASTRVEFILIPQKSASDPPTFYIMQNMVTNDLFRLFADANPDAVHDSFWEKGGMADGKDLMALSGLPVLRVTVTEADRCARWLGGRLPTTKQWDRAAGYPPTHDRPGPFKGSENMLAINRRNEGPRPISEADHNDESPFGVRDMAGNGCEFTRNLADGRTVPIARPTDKDLVILRGQRYTAARPLLYDDLKYQQDIPQVQYYRSASPYTGFRVVLEPEE